MFMAKASSLAASEEGDGQAKWLYILHSNLRTIWRNPSFR
jgi:hypothetical protein